MKYIWTEDTGAGLHFWELANEHLFQGEFAVESKGSNQGILDAARQLVPKADDRYYLAFDIVYDNMDVMNKYLELSELAAVYPKQVIILDMICRNDHTAVKNIIFSAAAMLAIFWKCWISGCFRKRRGKEAMMICAADSIILMFLFSCFLEPLIP